MSVSSGRASRWVLFRAVLLIVLLILCAACRREAPAPQPAPAATPPAPAAVSATELKDVVETTSNYVIGISYPPAAAKYPGLAAELRRYADDARAELVQAASERRPDAPAPYDLSLSFSMVMDSPALVAVAADGSSYTGGAHGAPLLERFVWLPQENRRLLASDLVPGKQGWNAISGYVREQLHTALSQRIDADDLDAAERAEVIKSAGQMIDEGTEADAAHFAQFEPVVGVGGKLSALRFVFAPYQVGPYSDGTQTVDVPASVLLPFLAPEYRGLFAGG
ncbi:DUF3298 and DUF4163 domain-containing protein [Lysobacter niastensis]|uniref:DUF3298 and DUF4163 domain-containing protein n=1 Tax=Lysobacter niastensis TaxID=380629 RepID=UPI002B4B4719|nr:hypothetical protein [Lysobacter niastensis]